MGKVRFPLNMADGTPVRTLEELREHFDLKSVLGYYEDKRLIRWLRNEKEYAAIADRIDDLDPLSDSFEENLCEILGVPYSRSTDTTHSIGGAVGYTAVAADYKRLMHLKQYTADDAILKALDRVAFTQEELNNLVCSGLTEGATIYLCGEYFIIPGNVDNITYVGKGLQGVHPKFMLDDTPVGAGVDLRDLEIDLDGYFKSGRDSSRFFQSFSLNKSLGFQILRASAEKFAVAMAVLGECYQKGFGVKEDTIEAVKWYQKAAELGSARAQSHLGHCYRYGEGVEKDIKESVKWSKRAAEQGDADAQTRLGILYASGDGVEKDLKKAAEWYQRAAEQGQGMAQYYLGLCYRDGDGVARNKDKAADWLRKAHKQGVESAEKALIEVAPKLFKLSEVILCAIGGEENLHIDIGARLDRASGTIDVPVYDRHKVNEALLYNFGADKVQIETYYVSYKQKKDLLGKYAKAVGGDVAAAAGLAVLGGPVALAAAYKAGKVVLEAAKNYKDGTEETVREDVGLGCVHILMDIAADMEEDFNCNLLPRIKSNPSESRKQG